MARRLFDEDEAVHGQGRVVLPTVPPLSLDQGHCALAACARAAVAATGQSHSYAWLMGLAGPAFMFGMAPRFAATAAVEGRWRHLSAVLRDLGWQPELVEKPSAEAIAALASRELEAGRPLLVKGWPPQPLDWAVVFGVEGTELLGRWPGSGRGPQRGECAADLVLALGPPGEPADVVVSVATSLRRALALLDESQRAYEAWLDLLAADMPYGPPLGQRDQVLAEQWLVQCLADARWAGQEFLRQAAELLPEVMAEGVDAAADLCAALAEDVEQLLVSPDAAGAGPWVDDPEWLARRRDTIAGLAEREADLADLLRRSLDEGTVQYVE